MRCLAYIHEIRDKSVPFELRECRANDPTVLEGWRIELDGARSEAGQEDYAYAERLE